MVEEAPIPPVAGGEAFDFIGTVQQLETTVTRVLALLASGGTPHEQAKIASQCAATLEKLAKLKGDDPVTRNRILKSEFWAAIKAAHLRALAPFPEASEALGKELRALETSE